MKWRRRVRAPEKPLRDELLIAGEVSVESTTWSGIKQQYK